MLPIGMSGLNASNSAFNVMNGAQNVSNLASLGGSNPEALANAGKNNATSMLQNETLYKISDASYDSDKKIRDENIKSTFDYMA